MPMMQRALLFVLILAACLAPSAMRAQTCGVRCGVERWAVKTFTDEDTGLVDLTPRDASVLELRAFVRPANVLDARRAGPVELSTYRVSAVLLGWKHERDDDFHLVIADPSYPDSTMIVEIPSARCSHVCSSRLVDAMMVARRAVEAELGSPSSTYRPLRPPRAVTVTGIGFLDFLHGQTGVAPNGIELHPVLDIRFQ